MTLADAVIARLQSQLVVPVGDDTIQIPVFDAFIDEIPPIEATGIGRYVALYCSDPKRASTSVSSKSTELSVTFQVTSVAWMPDNTGSPAQACRWLADKVRNALVDWRPAVDGWVGTGPIRHTFVDQPRVDEDVTDRRVVYGVDQFSVMSATA